MMDATSIINLINKAMSPIRRKLGSMVRLGVLSLLKDGNTQGMQVILLAGEIADDVKFFEDYGLTVKPPIGSETLVINVGGNVDNPIAIKVGSRKFRFNNLADGEVCLYTKEDKDSSGHRIHFKQGRNIEVCGDNIIVNASKTCSINATNSCSIKTTTANIEAEQVSIKANGISAEISGNATISATGSITFGGDGALGLARLGDMVEVSTGSSAGLWPIVTASTKVKAV